MKILKPHFWYNKSQRDGVFFLLLIIVTLQISYSFIDFSTDEVLFNNNEIKSLQVKIDSLKVVEKERRKPKIYPFNPNYLTDYRASKLGLSITEIDRLLVYREQRKFINSAKQFQQVTKISDSLLNKISPYFKFPNWVIRKNRKKNELLFNNNRKPFLKRKTIITDINKATAKDFQTVEGVSQFLAERIIKYRKRLHGFTFQEQILEVWRLDKQIAKKIILIFKVKERPKIKKVNVNTATFKQVLSNPYIDYKLCKKIFEFRDEVAELQSIEELKNIEGFPLDKYDRIVLYLEAK